MKRRIARLLSSLASPSSHRVGRRRHPRAHRSPDMLLDIAQLEDRILFSATPLSPEMLEGPPAQDSAELASVHDVLPDSHVAAEAAVDILQLSPLELPDNVADTSLVVHCPRRSMRRMQQIMRSQAPSTRPMH